MSSNSKGGLSLFVQSMFVCLFSNFTTSELCILRQKTLLVALQATFFDWNSDRIKLKCHYSHRKLTM